MSKFQIGDKVKLRDDLEVRRRYGKLEFLSGMRNLEGKELTIDFISEEGNYGFEESGYVCSEEMLKKVFNDSDLLEFALDKLLYMTKEELIERYKENKISEQDLEDIKRCCDNFKSYCSSRFCDNCDIHKFKKENGLNGLGLGTEICMLIYGYLFEKEGE